MLQEQLAYIQSLTRFGIKPGIKRMQKIMRALGDPHLAYPTIHISGTNGKGSTTAMTANALVAAGYKTASYTSPYLLSFNERIQINGSNISNKELIQKIAHIRQVSVQHGINLTYFEFATALAFLYFAEQHVDIAVIEVGMGGANDATNIVQPIVSAITNVSLDHTKWLGETKHQIAQEKAGVIKPNTPFVTAEKDPAICTFFEAECLHKKSPYINVLKNPLIATPPTNLLGQHQQENASTAYHILQHLRRTGLSMSESNIARGFATVQLPGRLQIFSKRPFILLDGAHNPQGIHALAHFLDTHIDKFPKPDTLVIGAKRDKDIQNLLTDIAPRFKNVICTQAQYQPMSAEKIARDIPHSQSAPELGKAIAHARAIQHPMGMLLITGSLYLVGDALTILHKKDPTSGSE